MSTFFVGFGASYFWLTRGLRGADTPIGTTG